ncbi:hypothetical protein IWQ49_006551 [Labrenzia sp. EL_126]|nr:hypothetical protein [Labrenzia sp. EL_126]
MSPSLGEAWQLYRRSSHLWQERVTTDVVLAYYKKEPRQGFPMSSNTFKVSYGKDFVLLRNDYIERSPWRNAKSTPMYVAKSSLPV